MAIPTRVRCTFLFCLVRGASAPARGEALGGAESLFQNALGILREPGGALQELGLPRFMYMVPAGPR